MVIPNDQLNIKFDIRACGTVIMLSRSKLSMPRQCCRRMYCQYLDKEIHARLDDSSERLFTRTHPSSLILIVTHSHRHSPHILFTLHRHSPSVATLSPTIFSSVSKLITLSLPLLTIYLISIAKLGVMHRLPVFYIRNSFQAGFIGRKYVSWLLGLVEGRYTGVIAKKMPLSDFRWLITYVSLYLF